VGTDTDGFVTITVLGVDGTDVVFRVNPGDAWCVVEDPPIVTTVGFLG